jgi:hypothetical protein
VCMGEDAFGVSISSLLGKLSFVVPTRIWSMCSNQHHTKGVLLMTPLPSFVQCISSWASPTCPWLGRDSILACMRMSCQWTYLR